MVGSGTNGKPTTVGAGGYFYGMTGLPRISTGGFDSDNAHALDKPISGHPESIEGRTEVLWCRSCHHHHGTPNTGDTRAADLPKGDPLVGGDLMISKFRNLIVPDGDNNILGKEISRTDTYYNKGLEDFCQRCHDLNTWSAIGDAYHPVGSATNIKDGGLTAGTNYESGMDDTDSFTLQPIIKPQDPAADDNRTLATKADRDLTDDDTVTCLTCHYAHGGPYKKMLRWDYGNYQYTWLYPNSDTTGAKVSRDSGAGCQMCHAR